MSTSSPVRTRQPRRPSPAPQAGSSRPPRGETAVIVIRSILLGVAAISVIATSNYFAYLIGRKQVTYEELRKQVDRVAQLVDQKREELALITSKQRQERLEQNTPGLTGLTTGTINAKTTATPEPPPAGRPIPAAVIESTAVVPPPREASLQPPESSPSVATKPHEVPGAAHKRVIRRQKVPPTAATAAAAPRRGPNQPASAEQPGQTSTPVPATADAGLGRQ